jgi:amino-acid N-acetyltransferase
MEVRNARAEDLESILELLKKNQLLLQGVEKHLQDFIVISEDRHLIGCAGLEIYGMVALLRSVAIREDRRRQGLGKSIIEEIFNMARKREIKELFLLTTTAPDFFNKMGFKRIERAKAHPMIQQTEEFSRLCPCSAIVMVRELQ